MSPTCPYEMNAPNHRIALCIIGHHVDLSLYLSRHMYALSQNDDGISFLLSYPFALNILIFHLPASMQRRRGGDDDQRCERSIR